MSFWGDYTVYFDSIKLSLKWFSVAPKCADHITSWSEWETEWVENRLSKWINLHKTHCRSKQGRVWRGLPSASRIICQLCMGQDRDREGESISPVLVDSVGQETCAMIFLRRFFFSLSIVMYLWLSWLKQLVLQVQPHANYFETNMNRGDNNCYDSIWF